MEIQKVLILKKIFKMLEITEVPPPGMVSRRMKVFGGFENNEEKFRDQAFINEFSQSVERTQQSIILADNKITATMIFAFINANERIWETALQKEFETDDSVNTDKPKAVVEQNLQQKHHIHPTSKPEESPFFDEIMKRLVITEYLEYHEFEGQILNYLDRIENNSSLLEEAVKAYGLVIYRIDPTRSYRMFMEEFIQFEEFYQNNLDSMFSSINIKDQGKTSMRMEAVQIAANYLGFLFELDRLINVANKVGGVGYSEEQIIEFFKFYLNQSIDKILYKPPKNSSYFKKVISTYDYDFSPSEGYFYPILEKSDQITKTLVEPFLNILLRIKIFEWSKNVQYGKEITVKKLLLTIQKEYLHLLDEEQTDPIPLMQMFERAETNVFETIINVYAKKLTYNFLLTHQKGGIERNLLEAFKNLGRLPNDLGGYLLILKRYYKELYEESWEEEFISDFILNTASKGLTSSSKQTVKKRVSLLVKFETTTLRKSHLSTDKVTSDTIYDILSKKLKTINLPAADFETAEEAQIYIRHVFTRIKLMLNAVWLQETLQNGFERYIDTPITVGWDKELIDLSREITRYYQDVTYLKLDFNVINKLPKEGLKFALLSRPITQDLVKEEQMEEFIKKLPRDLVLLDIETNKEYLAKVFEHGKEVINPLLNRKVLVETERKTFDQEIEERISIENVIQDWYIRGNLLYSSLILETISLEKTEDPFDNYLKTLYGGVFYLLEESLKGLRLDHEQKIRKGAFLRDLLSKQVHSILWLYSKIKITPDPKIVEKFLIDQIKVWDSTASLRNILTDLEADNQIQKSLSQSSFINENQSYDSLVQHSGIRGMFSRELISGWIKEWANSVFAIADVLSAEKQKESDPVFDLDEFEQEILENIFSSTGRDDIRNFIVPLILCNNSDVFGFETCKFSPNYDDYSKEVFSDAVSADAQISVLTLYENLKIEGFSDKRDFRTLPLGLDFIYYLGTKVISSNLLLGNNKLNLSDIVKKATGLSLSGQELETVIFQLGDENLFAGAIYKGSPYEGSEVTGLTLEFLAPKLISLNYLNPLVNHASNAISGFIERRNDNTISPDKLFIDSLNQMMHEASLILMYDSGTLQERAWMKIPEEDIGKSISKANLSVTTAYRMTFMETQSQNQTTILPEEIEYFGTKLENFPLFASLIVPFFQPGVLIKERILNDSKLKEKLDIKYLGPEDIFYPAFLVFNEAGKYKVVIGKLVPPNTMELIIAEEDDTSDFGLVTVQYLFKTKSFEEFISDFQLRPLNSLNQSLPASKIRVLKVKHGNYVLDLELIKNIGYGAI